MRINFACGARTLAGYFNVDIAQHPKASRAVDLIYGAVFGRDGALTARMPLPDGSAAEVMAIHFLEHIFPWEAPALLAEWHRLLKPGGLLVLEMPDLLKACRNLVEERRVGKHPDQGHMWAIYGDDTLRDPYMMHKAGWWFDRLKPVVEAVGFRKVVERDTVFHPAGRGVRDFRLEARKA